MRNQPLTCVVRVRSCFALLSLALLPLVAGATPLRTVELPFGDDDNIATISPFPTPQYETLCNWILQGLTAANFTPANGYYFAFAGSGVAAGIPNIPASDFQSVVYKPWVVTDVGFKDLGGQYLSRPVVDQEAGGADFELKYTPRPGTTDPTAVNWVQAYIDDINNDGFGQGTLDIPKGGSSPYYNAAGAAGTLKHNAAWMADIPYTCEDGGGRGCSGGVDDSRISEEVLFQTFVAGATPVMLKDASGQERPYIILYGGEQWGYTYSSIDTTPEPALGIVTGMLMMLAIARCEYAKHVQNHLPNKEEL